MTAATANPTPLLDGPYRGWFVGVVLTALALMTIDGMFTLVDANDADLVIEQVSGDTAIDDRGLLLSAEQRAAIAAETDGTRLDRDLVTTKTWLAASALIAAVGLTLAQDPGSSRNVTAVIIVVAAAAFFAPIYFFRDTIDIVTTAHGG